MPKEYEEIRNSLEKSGKGEKEAKHIAAATYNKRHPGHPMGPHTEHYAVDGSIKPISLVPPSNVPNYTDSVDPRICCATCFYYKQGTCTMFNFTAMPDKVCDEWEQKPLPGSSQNAPRYQPDKFTYEPGDITFYKAPKPETQKP